MKNAKLLIAFAYTALMLLAPAVAQTVPFQVNVPFDFIVGDQKMPAGFYRVAILYDVELQVVRIDGSSVANVLTTHVSGVRLSTRPPVCFSTAMETATIWPKSGRAARR